MIPAINGTFKQTSETFTLPETYRTEGGREDILSVFAARVQSLGTAPSASADTVLRFSQDASLPEEAYRLNISPSEITLTAASDRGHILALTTLFQFLTDGNGTIPCGTIEDAPRFHHRAFMLDVCRHFFPVEEVKKIIDQASLLKMNRFHWHLSDDQGYRIESKAFPRLNEISSWRKLARLDPMVTSGQAAHGDTYGGFYTFDEIRDVVAFAAARGIEVIPEIDLPGHSSAVLAAFPQYTCSGEPLQVRNTFGVHERIWCAGNEETYAFLDQLLTEVTSLFPSPLFHIGGDEAPKAAWKACPRCQALYAAKGFTNWEQVQTEFMNRVIGILEGKGKTPIVWNDSVATGALDARALTQYWAEMGPGESYVLPEVQKGRKMILSNADQFYCTDSYAALPLRATLSFEPNVKGNPIPDESVEGIETAMWVEWIASCEDLEKQLYPRMLAVAECAWCKEKNTDEFMSRAQKYLSLPALNILTGESWDKVTISGDAALNEIAMSLMMLGARYRAMSDAEKEDGGEGGMVGAVTPDSDKADNPTAHASPEQMIAMIRAHVAGKNVRRLLRG